MKDPTQHLGERCLRLAKRAAAAAVLALALAPPAHAMVPSDLCTGNPCIISGNVTLDGSFFDFGDTTDLRFASNANVHVKGDYFRAGTITLEAGARLTGGGLDCDGVDFEAVSGGFFMKESAGVLSRIELTGNCPGSTSAIAYPTGDVVIDGVIDVSGVGQYASGGSIGIEGNKTTVHGTLKASAGIGYTTGGFINILSDVEGIEVTGTMAVNSTISGGVIEIDAAGGDVSVTGSVDIRGGSDSGGRLGITAEVGNVTLGGSVLGTGSTGNGYYSCSGDPSVDVHAPGNLTLTGTMQLNGIGVLTCPSGFLDFEVDGGITMLPGARISAAGEGLATGGNAYIRAGGDVVLRDINMSGQHGAGSLDLETSGGAIQVLGGLQFAGEGAQVTLTGCDVYVASKASINTTGPSGNTDLTASETMTIVGKLQSSANGLRIREGAPLITGIVTPPPTVTVVPGLPDCRPGPSCTPGGTCGDGVVQCGEECDDGAANGTPSSTCDASCVEIPPALRIPGGGALPLDCPYEWSAAFAPASIAVDPRGLPKTKQSCHDNDPTCDFEPAPGVCKLHVWSCLGGADSRIACSAAQVSATSVLTPRSNAKPAELAVRQSIEGALQALGYPVGPGETCTGRYDVVIGVGQKALNLKTKATFAGTKKDTDGLQLTCTP
ncbi:MAG TPA: hypothetical protein VFD92_11135 [Candidatus Binatia bacterium]|nr:hypothetical protein [Candidatus Binatia bacterium]